MRPLKLVLVVDGDADRLGRRRFLLETQAYLRVVPCASAEDALVLLRGGLRVELMLTQLRLPAMDGNVLCAMCAQLDPLMGRILLDEVGQTVPPDSWAHRYLGSKASSRDLLEVSRVLVARKRGPRKSAAVRAGMARAAAEGGAG